ncbi:uncharacterized protein LOC112571953 isoform X2 [Pomacea canaliculata]|uniref:uncharacterized protein LOC112571953 isoform X2 n=1 Tax=Pomacea canaliculata TaxID=400727 RepID=UPI000D7280F5|nr:uncharacterized protein LOC112571953 isoform X2 [Pomacea canaliculata]
MPRPRKWYPAGYTLFVRKLGQVRKRKERFFAVDVRKLESELFNRGKMDVYAPNNRRNVTPSRIFFEIATREPVFKRTTAFNVFCSKRLKGTRVTWDAITVKA